MAAMSENPIITEPAITKKGRSKRALKPKNASLSQANIVIGALGDPSPAAVAPTTENSAAKENHQCLSQKKTQRGASKSKKQVSAVSTVEKELQEMQQRFEKLKLEKMQAEEMLKARDESLKLKDEELETRYREQEKLKNQLKNLQKMEEFEPEMTFQVGISMNDQDQEKKAKKKISTKKPSPPYILWCEDQWNEVKKSNPGSDFKEMSNLLGAKWRIITAEEKKPYEEKYQTQKEAYLKVMGNEKREQEAMRLLEDEQKQNTAMELLDYLQFKQQTGKENKKTKSLSLELYEQKKDEKSSTVMKEEEKKQQAMRLIRKKEKMQNLIVTDMAVDEPPPPRRTVRPPKPNRLYDDYQLYKP